MRRSDQNQARTPKVIAVSSPHGSTGKTTVALSIAMELASNKARVLLIDGDILGSAIANHLLLSDLPAGLPGALRIASQGRFDSEQLERLSVKYPKSSLSLLLGGNTAAGFKLEPLAIGSIFEVAKVDYEFIVVDLGAVRISSLMTEGQDLTELVLGLSDIQIFVCLADPIGIFRLLSQEKEILGIARSALVVMNRVRNSVIQQARKEIAVTLQRLSSLEVQAFLPDDPQQIDQALRTGVPVVSLSRSGAFRQSITGFVRAEIMGTVGQLDSRVAKLV